MKRILILLLLICNSCCSQNKKLSTNIDLEGLWQRTLEDGYSSECPNVIEFLSDTEYAIYNDCDVINPTTSLVEKGKFEVRNKTIFLYDREPVLKEYFFKEIFGKDSIISFRIKELRKNKLILGWIKNKNNSSSLYFKKINLDKN